MESVSNSRQAETTRIHTLRQRANESAEVICLLELSLAHFDNVLQILAHLVEQLAANRPFASEEAIERVLVLGRLRWEGVELLGQESKPFLAAFKQRPHPRRLLSTLRFGSSRCSNLIIIIR